MEVKFDVSLRQRCNRFKRWVKSKTVGVDPILLDDNALSLALYIEDMDDKYGAGGEPSNRWWEL